MIKSVLDDRIRCQWQNGWILFVRSVVDAVLIAFTGENAASQGKQKQLQVNFFFDPEQAIQFTIKVNIIVK